MGLANGAVQSCEVEGYDGDHIQPQQHHITSLPRLQGERGRGEGEGYTSRYTRISSTPTPHPLYYPYLYPLTFYISHLLYPSPTLTLSPYLLILSTLIPLPSPSLTLSPYPSPHPYSFIPHFIPSLFPPPSLCSLPRGQSYPAAVARTWLVPDQPPHVRTSELLS